jgi:hypothetical protein
MTAQAVYGRRVKMTDKWDYCHPCFHVLCEGVRPAARPQTFSSVPVLMSSHFDNPIVHVITDFLLGIGLPVEASRFPETTVLPGIKVQRGRLLFDETRLLYPGDLLHEAGHLAVMPAHQRPHLSGDLGSSPAEEMMAIAWSWAALTHLGIAPEVVFHETGYRGGSRAIIENFSKGRYVGVPMLQWVGLTSCNRKAQGTPQYPRMLRWLRD